MLVGVGVDHGHVVDVHAHDELLVARARRSGDCLGKSEDAWVILALDETAALKEVAARRGASAHSATAARSRIQLQLGAQLEQCGLLPLPLLTPPCCPEALGTAAT